MFGAGHSLRRLSFKISSVEVILGPFKKMPFFLNSGFSFQSSCLEYLSGGGTQALSLTYLSTNAMILLSTILTVYFLESIYLNSKSVLGIVYVSKYDGLSGSLPGLAVVHLTQSLIDMV